MKSSDGPKPNTAHNIYIVHTGMYVYIKIDQPQLPWLQTAIHVCHTGLDAKNERHCSAQDTFHASSDAYHVMRKTRIQTT